MRSFLIYILHHILLGYQIKECEMGKTYARQRNNKKLIHNSWLMNIMERTHFGDLERTIFKLIVMKCDVRE
jgi:hypothetical protein